MWIILIGIVLLGLIALALGYFKVAQKTEHLPVAEAEEACCGQHATCEKDSLLAAASRSVDYFDDEELDRFKGCAPEGYDATALAAFEEVFYSLQESDVAPWLRSLQLRGVPLPPSIKEEALMIVTEIRARKDGMA